MDFLIETLSWLNSEEEKYQSAQAQTLKSVSSELKPTHFDVLFDFFKTIGGGSEFNSIVIEHLNQQIHELKQRVKEGIVTEEECIKQREQLFHYFFKLYNYLESQLDKTQSSGVVFATGQSLLLQCDAELYEDDLESNDPESVTLRAKVTVEDRMDNIRITAECIPEGLVLRMQLYCKLAVEVIFRSLPVGRVNFFPRTPPMSPRFKAALDEVVYRRLQDELERHVAHSGLRRKCSLDSSLSSAPSLPGSPGWDHDSEVFDSFHEKLRAKSISPLPPIQEGSQSRSESASPSQQLVSSGDLTAEPSLQTAVVQSHQKPSVSLSFKQKWHSLSFKKKCIFGSVLAIGVIGIIAAGVFVPGSAIVTIPGVGVLTAKILAVLVGSVAVVTSAAVMGCMIKRHKPASDGARWGLSAAVFHTTSTAHRPAGGNAESHL